MSHTVLRQKVKIGTKGQAVIPVAMRKAKGIFPHSEVVFEMDSEKNIRVENAEPAEDPIAVFRRVATEINLKGKLDMNKLYDEQMEEYWAKKTKRQ